MSIYSKSVSQMDTNDLAELLTDRAVENARLEFKSEVPDKDEILKKLSSFGNTFGGFLIIGARAESSDGRLQTLPGVEAQPGFKQKIIDWCFAGAAPPITAEVSDPIKTPSNENRFCYVIHIAESDIAPHFLNGRKGVWVRTDEFSSRFEARLASETELRLLFDRRKLTLRRRARLVQRARRRFETFMSSEPRKASISTHKLCDTRMELCLIPRFPARPVCEHSELAPTIRASSFLWRQFFFPNETTEIIAQQDSAIILLPTKRRSILEINTWGMHFYGAEIAEDHNGTFGIHLFQFCGYLLAFLRFSAEVFQKLSYSGPVRVNFGLRPVLEVAWLDPFQGHLSERRGSPLDNRVAFDLDTTTDVLQKERDQIVGEIIKSTLIAVNLAELVAPEHHFKRLILGGYTFNYWQPV